MTSTQQVSVRLPTDLVAFADEVVREGRAKSRAAVLSSALEHERQRLADEKDAAIYGELAERPDPELETWTRSSRARADRVWSDLD